MKSPFPGMDPYLERHWTGVHNLLISYAGDALNERLPEDLSVVTEERVAIESPDEEGGRSYVPDIRIVKLPDDSAPEEESGGVVAPVRLYTYVEPLRELYLTIVESGSERVITVIEILSPANKRGQGLVEFKNKRTQFLNGGVNLVEIDLVRGGDWRKLMLPQKVPARHSTTYRVATRLASDPGAIYLHPIRLADPLPQVHIPLRKDDREVKLDLQQLIEKVYANRSFDRRINYRDPCDPALEGEEAAWTDRLLRDAGKR